MGTAANRYRFFVTILRCFAGRGIFKMPCIFWASLAARHYVIIASIPNSDVAVSLLTHRMLSRRLLFLYQRRYGCLAAAMICINTDLSLSTRKFTCRCLAPVYSELRQPSRAGIWPDRHTSLVPTAAVYHRAASFIVGCTTSFDDCRRAGVNTAFFVITTADYRHPTG